MVQTCCILHDNTLHCHWGKCRENRSVAVFVQRWNAWLLLDVGEELPSCFHGIAFKIDSNQMAVIGYDVMF